MRKFLLSLLALLTFSIPLQSKPSLAEFARHGIFMLERPDIDENGKPMTSFGTAFCRPGSSNVLLTAAHVIGPDMTLADYKNDHFEVTVLLKDEKHDVGMILTEAKVCELNGFRWAAKNGKVGDSAWVYGFALGMSEPLLTGGIISAPAGAYQRKPDLQPAQIGGTHGDSGAPVFDANEDIIGIEMGGFDGVGINMIVPVEVIRKVVK
jgi:S1-C subfamily serine protease